MFGDGAKAALGKVHIGFVRYRDTNKPRVLRKLVAGFAILVGYCSPLTAQYTINTIAGGGGPPDDTSALSLGLTGPAGLARDTLGNLYIAAGADNRIYRVDVNGIVTTVAGDGTSGYSGDNGPAAAAQLNDPLAVAVDGAGSLYIADSLNNCIRKVTNGVITTIAGNGNPGNSGDNGSARAAQLANPSGVAVDGMGNLYIADEHNNRVRKVTDGVITTVVGNGIPGYSGDNGPATAALLHEPSGIAVDATSVCLNLVTSIRRIYTSLV